MPAEWSTWRTTSSAIPRSLRPHRSRSPPERPCSAIARWCAPGSSAATCPAHTELVLTLNNPTVPELAKTLGTTRSAAAVELLAPAPCRRHRADRQRADRAVPPARADRCRRATPGRHHRRAGRLRGGIGEQGLARRAPRFYPVPHRTRAPRRLGHRQRRLQRNGQTAYRPPGCTSSEWANVARASCPAPTSCCSATPMPFLGPVRFLADIEPVTRPNAAADLFDGDLVAQRGFDAIARALARRGARPVARRHLCRWPPHDRVGAAAREHGPAGDRPARPAHRHPRFGRSGCGSAWAPR